MSAIKASLMALKIGDGAVSETFTAIAGFRQFDFRIAQQWQQTNDVMDASWRSTAPDAVARIARLAGQGIFTDSAAEQQLYQAAISGLARNYQCCFANGDMLQGAFVITQYQRSGQIEGEEQFSLLLESAGNLQSIT